MSSVVILDLETTTKKHLGRTASPFCEENWIVAGGFQEDNGKPFGQYYDEPQKIVLPDLTNTKLIVAHNAKFDLLYLWEYPEIQEYIKRGGKIWCTQLAEYLINGMMQEYQMASLNDCAVRYGGNTKIDAVKEMWQQGINTPDIPEDLLMDYLLGTGEMEGDIGNTYRVFLGQVKAIQSYPAAFRTMLANRFDSLLATTEMEYNGLYVDTILGEQLRADLKTKVDELTVELESYLPEMPEECIFKWTSGYDKSYLIFGGCKKYEKWVQHTDEEGNLLYANKIEKWPLFNAVSMPPNHAGRPLDKDSDNGLYIHHESSDGCIQYQDTFKSGKRKGEGKTKNVDVPDLTKPKGAKQDHYYDFPGFTRPLPRWKGSQTDGKGNQIYSTSADVIEALGNRNVPFLKSLSTRAKLTKDLGTYYWDEDKSGIRSGMLCQVGDDGIIHHSLNHTSTVTSRMSSSNPNLQNIPRKDTSDVKQMFKSRFGDDGYIVEMDYSALEVYVQAILTDDTNMKKQLRDGIDFHCFRLSVKLGEDYGQVYKKCKDESHPEHKEYDKQRTKVKGFSFQLAYGAGAASISESIGMPIEDVKELMELEKQNYPSIELFYEMLEAEVTSTYTPTSRTLYVDGKTFNVGFGYWFSPTGTKYCFQEHETPEFLWERGKFTGFSPTERKNYPVQGFGGEIMQTMLGLLYRWFIRNDHFGGKALLVNTVHDSVYLDIHKDVIHDVVPTCVAILAAVKHKFNRDFDIGIDVDFKVDAEIGKSMYAVNGYKPETNY